MRSHADGMGVEGYMENREGSSIFRARNRRYGAPPATNASERPLDFHYKPLSACGWMERERKRERRASDIFLIFCVGCAFPVMRRIETERPGEETEREKFTLPEILNNVKYKSFFYLSLSLFPARILVHEYPRSRVLHHRRRRRRRRSIAV